MVAVEPARRPIEGRTSRLSLRVVRPFRVARPVGGPGSAGGLEGKATLLTLSTVAVSALNYAFALVMIRLLSTAQYVRYVSVQGVLLVLGTGCMAAVPWAVAQHVAVTRPSRSAAPTDAAPTDNGPTDDGPTDDGPADAGRVAARRAGPAGEALHFGLAASAVQGAVFAVVAAAIVVPTGGVALGLWSAGAAFALSLVAAPLGVLQGWERLTAIAGLRLAEAGVRTVVSVALVLGVAATATSPVAGFVAGSVVLLAVALWRCRAAFPLARAGGADLRRLLVRSLTLGGVQILLASLGVVDTVVITLTRLGGTDASGYQVAALLGRVPLFLSSAVALSYFPAMVAAPSDRWAYEQLLRALRLFARLGLPAALLVAALPSPVVALLAPGRAGAVTTVLPATAAIGTCVGLATVLTTWQQARGRFRVLFVGLVPVVVAQPLVLVGIGRHGSIPLVGAIPLVGSIPSVGRGPLIAYALAGVVLTAVAVVVVLRDVTVRGWGRVLRPTDLLLLGSGGLAALMSRVAAWPSVGAGPRVTLGIWSAAALVLAPVVLRARRAATIEERPRRIDVRVPPARSGARHRA